MGWKATRDITREEAISAINSVVKHYEDASNKELENIMYALGIGDDTSKPYFGYNFNIIDDETK